MHRKDKKMCKYCKNLKRIKDLNENEYKKIIHKWKHHVYLGEKIMKEAQTLLLKLKTENIIDHYEKHYVIERIKKYLTTEYIN